MASATLYSLLLLALPITLFMLVYGWSRFWNNAFSLDFIALLLIFIAAVILHEAIHAVGWKVFGGLAWSDLTFGIDRKTLSPYCHARAPMRAQAYRIGAALPGILTGIVPALVGIVFADAALTLLSAVMVSAAVGDALVLWVIRDVPPQAWVLDHPKNAGCYVKLD
jgi:hypothetical protein